MLELRIYDRNDICPIARVELDATDDPVASGSGPSAFECVVRGGADDD